MKEAGRENVTKHAALLQAMQGLHAPSSTDQNFTLRRHVETTGNAATYDSNQLAAMTRLVQ
jgi:hypothetical protein